MKLFKNIMLLAAATLFAACETDVDTPQVSSPSDFVAPVIGTCSDVIVNADNSKDESVVFTWTAADFGLPVQVLYTVYVSNGSSTTSAGTSNTTSLVLSKGDFNGVVINGLGVAANEEATLTAYVTATISGSDYTPIVSNTSNSFKVTTYAAALKNYYLVGFFNGWDATAAVEIWETGGATNTFAGMYHFFEDKDNTEGYSGWKFISERSWNGTYNWGYDAFETVGNNIGSSSDGNLLVEAGIWEVSINPGLKSVEGTKIGQSLGLIGDFNSWGADAFFTYDAVENVWKTEAVTLEAGQGIKIRANEAWDINWGDAGTTSTTINGGIELSKGAGNISVPASGTYIAVLHSDRTPYVFELVAQ